MRALTLVCACLALCPLPAAAERAEIRVATLPGRVLVERGAFDQRLNFDFLIQNATAEQLEISSVEVWAYAADHSLVSQRRVGTNGDSILTVPNRTVEPGAKIVVFNPFHTFEPDLQLATLRYEFALDATDAPEKYRAEITISPVPYETKTSLVLPADGRLLAYDGPDLYGHHRRLDITGGLTTAFGITSNFMRYAYDFCVVDAQGKMFRGTGEANEDWYGFGTPIYAPGAGRVVAAANGVPDNTASKRVPISREDLMKDLRVAFGNYVVIDHLNGEYSFLAHMKQGSVCVAVGQAVRQGEKVGEMGFSGDAFLVHLHYQLQSDAGFGEGLPAHFRSYRRYVGATAVAGRGFVDSGDVVSRLPSRGARAPR
jgi:murein DD-endopeptidase MepM/ murein hydrolase activator NlpD